VHPPDRRIRKAVPPAEPGGRTPNLVDYDVARAAFSWDAARAELDGLPGGRGLNIAHEAVDRHALGARAGHTALRVLTRDGEVVEITYRELATRSNRFANVLDRLGVARGDTVFVLLSRVPDLYAAVMGTFKHVSVVSPLFPAFGPEPIRQRITLGAGRVLVTTAALYRRKVEPVRAELPGLEHVLLVGHDAPDLPGTHRLDDLLSDAGDEWEIPPTDPDDRALIHFTSGTTGTPKGAVHVHEAVVSHHTTAALALDIGPDDVFWCTADPGWVTGMSYGVIAPLTIGATNLVDEAEFDAERWYSTLEAQSVTVWYTAPTAIRMLMRVGPEPVRAHDLGALRFVASVGEPLNPEAVAWGVEVLGRPIHDNWWQTETGGIMVANYAACDVKPGSMGRPLPGIDVALLARDEDDDEGGVLLRDGEPVVIEEPDVEGHLAIRVGWPSMFRAYLDQPERYARCFVGDWYVSGDLARQDADGYLWFVGRADDVIKSAGHLVGPFEVESTLLEHPAVAEAGVIGIPDPVAGAVIKAFVSLHAGHEPDEALRRELLGFARARLGPAIAPRTIEFDQALPHTRSGKIMRRLLKARELGLPEGDLSTLETSS
jgi:acetyl-CoA synthetase